MLKILFVCMGNICRSPAAEGIMNQLLINEKLDDKVFVDSAGTIDFHSQELPDERMRRQAKIRGYVLDSKARQFDPKKDFEEFNYIVTMDNDNFRVINNWDIKKKYSNKIYKMAEFSSDKSIKEIPDPFYGANKEFDNVLDILEDCTKTFLNKIKTDIERINKK